MDNKVLRVFLDRLERRVKGVQQAPLGRKAPLDHKARKVKRVPREPRALRVLWARQVSALPEQQWSVGI
ncbi:MAG: hypothetical protein C4542_01370 [Dehalococcoidia bacterium]|nr:MAG: hypothetical protein C4542_01370 [Dehalococcoidia bacterium]